MKGLHAFACIGDVDLDLIEESAVLLEATPTMALTKPRRERPALSRFFANGWGVAVLCAVVSISVLSAIIWAGRQGPVTPPLPGTEETDTAHGEREDPTDGPEESGTLPEGETPAEADTADGTEPDTRPGEDTKTEDGTEAVFQPDITADGITFLSNGDGTCRIKGADKTYKGSITVPEVSPYGERVTTVASGAFRGFTEITEVILPDSVTVIKGSAFQGCGSLVSVELPPAVTEFGRAMFDRCGELRSVVLPAGLTEIPAATFQTCVNLQRVVAQEGITAIGANAFNGCRSLHELTLPAGLKSIGSAAFMNCCGLVTIYYGGTLSEWEDVEIHEYQNAHLGHARIVSGSN